MAATALRDITRHLDQRLAKAKADNGLAKFQAQALEKFKLQGLPTAKTEDWKYTSLRKLADEPFSEPMADTPVEIPPIDARHLLVMVNGCLQPELSRISDLPSGVSIAAMDSVPVSRETFMGHRLGSIADIARHPFAAINSASFSKALFIELAQGTQVAGPLVILWLACGSQQALVQPRMYVRLKEGSGITMMEQHLGGHTGHLINKVSEFSLGDSARLSHVQLQNPSAERLINGAHVRCGRDSFYSAQNYDLGGSFIRNDLVVSLAGTGGEAKLDGLFISSNDGHVDNHIRVDHSSPHCLSSVLYKGLLGERGHGVFNGKLIVHPGALQTDARQVNHNLLLSTNAEINAKPELEIYADDVKCSHGCTTGELDRDQLFYLLSRGIGRNMSRRLLVEAFAREIVDRQPEKALASLIEPALGSAIGNLVEATKELQK